MEISIPNKLPKQLAGLEESFRMMARTMQNILYNAQVTLHLEYEEGTPSKLKVYITSSLNRDMAIAVFHKLSEINSRCVVINTDFSMYQFLFGYMNEEVVFMGSLMNDEIFKETHPTDIVRWIAEYLLNNVQTEKPMEYMNPKNMFKED